MNHRLIFVLNAVVAAVVGVVFLAIPEYVVKQFNSDPYAVTFFLVRFLGGTLLIIGLLDWFGKDATETSTQKGLAFASLAGALGGFALTLLGIAGSSAVIRANGWIALVVFGFFALTYAYILFLQPQAAEAKPRSSRKSKSSQNKPPKQDSSGV